MHPDLMSEQIIVGYDGTSSSAEAVLWATHEAACRKVRLRIVSCYDIPFAGEAGFGWAATESINDLLATTDRRLQEVRDMAVHAHPSVNVQTVTSAGPPAVALLDGLRSNDMVVLGASGHHGKAAFWLRSTPRALIRHSPCPVVVAHGAVSRGRPDRVVVGIDGSASSERTLRWAASEADLHHAPLVVVHSWWYPHFVAEDGRSQARDLTQVDAECVLDPRGRAGS